MRMTTTIHVSDETWHELHQRKQRGESFDDVLKQMLGVGDEE